MGGVGGGYLKCVKHLLLDLLQLVLHLYHDVLHLGLIRLRAGGIDFATHLLRKEAELLALSWLVGHGLTEVLQVVRQALLLLADVQLLNIVNQLLF